MKLPHFMPGFALALATSPLGVLAAHAGCPTLESGLTAKYVAVYVQNPDNVGSSWRLYVRPRNGSCLYASMDYKSPADASGHASARVHPGDKNCEDSYKSYVSLSVPSPSAIWGTWTAEGKPTMVGVSLKGTLNPGGNDLAIAFVPMSVDGKTFSQTSSKVAGICFK